MPPARTAVVGLGAWGRNLVRVFSSLSDLAVCCHLGNVKSREWAVANYPAIPVTTDIGSILTDDSIDAIVIATPIDTHFELASRALAAGKHVFVEKPACTSSEQMLRLISLARDENRVLFVGHVFLFEDSLQTMVDRITTDPPRSFSSTWWKCGSFLEPLEWNLLTHDAAIVLSLFRGDDSPPSARAVLARSVSRLNLTVEIAGGRTGTIEINRLSPFTHKSLSLQTEAGVTLVWEPGRLHEFDGSGFRVIHESKTQPLVTEAGAFLASLADGFSEPRAAFDAGVVGFVETVTALGTNLAG